MTQGREREREMRAHGCKPRLWYEVFQITFASLDFSHSLSKLIYHHTVDAVSHNELVLNTNQAVNLYFDLKPNRIKNRNSTARVTN